MTNDVATRTALVDDLDLVVRLRLRFLAEVRGVDEDSFDADFVTATRAYLAAGLSDGSLRAWVAEAGEGEGRETVGTVSAVISHRPPVVDDLRTGQAHVLNLWVDPAFRRRGLGRALLHAVEHDARELGLRELVLHTTDDGRALYAAAGFRPNELWRELALPPA